MNNGRKAKGSTVETLAAVQIQEPEIVFESAGHRGRQADPQMIEAKAALERTGRAPEQGKPLHFVFAGTRYVARLNAAGETVVMKAPKPKS